MISIAQIIHTKIYPLTINTRKKGYSEYSGGWWMKTEFDDKRNLIYFEELDGVIRDDRS